MFRLTVDAKGVIVEADAAASRLLERELVGVSVDVLAGGDHARLRKAVAPDEARPMARTLKLGQRYVDVAFGAADVSSSRHVWVADRTTETTVLRLLELGLDLACTATDGLHFDYLSPSWEKTLGWSLEELRARPFVEFVHPEDVPATAAVAEEMLASQGVVQLFRNRYRHKSGSWVWLEWMARVADNMFWASARDVTRLVEVEARQTRTLREMEQFSYAAAHDLKAPLRRITSLARSAVMALEAGDNEKLVKRLEQIAAAGEDGSSVVEAALEYACLGGEVTTAPADVEDAIGAALRRSGVLHGGAPLSAKGPEGVTVRYHKEGLVAAITNLLDNAKKYGDGSAISITWDNSAHGGAWIAVADQGRGFDPEWAERVWEPAWRGHSDVAGHGFGLAKVRKLIESMGGAVRASSPGPGKGAVFVIELEL